MGFFDFLKDLYNYDEYKAKEEAEMKAEQGGVIIESGTEFKPASEYSQAEIDRIEREARGPQEVDGVRTYGSNESSRYFADREQDPSKSYGKSTIEVDKDGNMVLHSKYTKELSAEEAASRFGSIKQQEPEKPETAAPATYSGPSSP